MKNKIKGICQHDCRYIVIVIDITTNEFPVVLLSWQLREITSDHVINDNNKIVGIFHKSPGQRSSNITGSASDQYLYHKIIFFITAKNLLVNITDGLVQAAFNR